MSNIVINKKFAWLPLRMEDGKLYWLCFYYAKQELCSGSLGLGSGWWWHTIAIYRKHPNENE